MDSVLKLLLFPFAMVGLLLRPFRRHAPIVANPAADRSVVVQITNGQIPTLASCSIILKKGEVAHFEGSATLLKWKSTTQWKGASHGYSFRITKGVYYRVGQTRGHLETTGQHLIPADEGTFTITSQRAVFSGSRRVLEFSFSKLVNIEVFTDGLHLAVSNRQEPSILKLPHSEVAAAIISVAAQKVAA